MEELQVEEVDDAGSSSFSDVDTFLRLEHTHSHLSLHFLAITGFPVIYL
uniref:Uncharacterized protein n=1 Tax=Arundo donax TaxID=35708 RepID=A0A0A9FIU0_ARUDO